MIDMDELIKSWEIFRDKMISALTGKGKEIMLDREKVIKGLDHCYFGGSGTCYEKECPYYQSNDCTEELKNDILVLLKEQEAKPMIESERGWNCPSCGINLIGKSASGYPCNLIDLPEDEPIHFCPMCGQAVKWE